MHTVNVRLIKTNISSAVIFFFIETRCLTAFFCLPAAAAAAKSLQSCPTLCDPIDGSPPGSPWDSPGKNTGVGCHFLFQCMKVKVKSLSCVPLIVTPWTAAYQAPPSMGFSRQEYWSGVPLPSPPSGAVVKNFPSNAEDTRDADLIPGSGIFPWSRK